MLAHEQQRSEREFYGIADKVFRTASGARIYLEHATQPLNEHRLNHDYTHAPHAAHAPHPPPPPSAPAPAPARPRPSLTRDGGSYAILQIGGGDGDGDVAAAAAQGGAAGVRRKRTLAAAARMAVDAGERTDQGHSTVTFLVVQRPDPYSTRHLDRRAHRA